ncbi:glycosyltransferase family 4 protein [Polaribacter haliotis]|uniref:Glycosyltransferase family 4 protein n=1 Tax=Polaribacter haliotis TaxID=1888915 RepID=A0A7L8AHM0_9FLAO|nr:glycosyltransferase family 4 protein [Polaribacter haliotis]QOD61502.1 glycosyltransferase family 4 protein [Polaribacter haliotis]
MKEKIVIISNYYPPEMGAAANRIKSLAEGLLLSGKEVTVICPLPNYPKGEIFPKYKGKFKVVENKNGILVKRYWMFPSNSKNSFVRIFSMFSLAISIWASIFSLLRNKPKLFIIQSPPLFVALSGLLLSKVIGRKNVLNVSDLWPLSALELGVINKGFFYKIFTKLEHTNYKLANKIVGQSKEINKHISKIVKKENLVYRNVPNYKEYSQKTKKEGKLKIVYAGLLGYAQGILNICKSVDFKNLQVEFHIYGDGMESKSICNYAKNANNNIFFHGSVDAIEVKEKIRENEVAIVPLKNRIQGAVPSKIFELMQLGVPILYTCEGEASDIILSNNIGFVSYNNTSESLKNTILKFKNLKEDEYTQMSKNCLDLHAKEYRLDYQLKKVITFIENEK